LQSRAAIAAQDIFDNILDRRIEWPDGEGALSDAGRDLVDRLLQPDPAQRLGARGAGEARRGPARRPRLAGQGAACGRFTAAVRHAHAFASLVSKKTGSVMRSCVATRCKAYTGAAWRRH